MPCPRQCRKVALERYGERLHLTLQIWLETSFAKRRFSIAPEALTGFGGFPAGKAVRGPCQGPQGFDHAVKIPSCRVV
jgi:hypothetical protein